MSRYLPRPVGKFLTRYLERSSQRPWIPVPIQRGWMEAVAKITRVPDGVSVSHGSLGGRPCDLLTPAGADPDRVVLYLHGGAYVVCSPRTHRAYCGHVAVAAGALLHLLDYRLGPEHKHPAALEDALAAYRELLERGLDPGSIVIAGDSAGGGLTVALATRLRELGEPMPVGLVLLCGWFDLTVTGPSAAFNARRDAGLHGGWTAACGDLYRGETDPTDPQLSPIHADLGGLPSTYVQAATHDILLSDSDRLVERARAAGVDVGYDRYEGLWHDFQAGADLLREADQAMTDIGRACERIWKGRPLAEENASRNGSRNGRPTPRVLIVGGGFGGVGLGMSLKREGIESFTILEKAEGIGGVWRDNTYPGAACDVPSHLYSFSFEPKADWTRRYSPQPEILDYLESCVARYGLAPHLRFGVEVARADFDQDTDTWRVTTTDGEEIEADVLVTSTGQLSLPATTRIPGTEKFGGPIFHSARWDHDLDLAGKRVAVIGTGASTIQIVPAIAERVAQLDVYQRSAPYVIEKRDRAFRDWEKRLFRIFPPARLYQRFKEWLFFEVFVSAFNQFKPLGKVGVRLFEKNLEQQVSDPELRRALSPDPDHVLGCKRVLISADYYSTFERPNVELVTQGVRELTKDGVIAEDGTERPTDVVVLSTGFQTTRFLAPMEIHGEGGLDLNEVWRDGAEAYLGMTVAGFPNLFVMYGPNTNLGSGSIIYQLESQMNYILDGVRMLGRNGGRLAVRAEVQRAFDSEVQERLSTSVWQTGCSNWYVDENGRDSQNWPGFTIEYRHRTRHLRPEDYESTSGL